jgi:hypothetical protein
MRTIANYMPFGILCGLMQSGEVALYESWHFRVVGIRPESGTENIKNWLVTLRDKYGEIQEVYLKLT